APRETARAPPRRCTPRAIPPPDTRAPGPETRTPRPPPGAGTTLDQRVGTCKSLSEQWFYTATRPARRPRADAAKPPKNLPPAPQSALTHGKAAVVYRSYRRPGSPDAPPKHTDPTPPHKREARHDPRQHRSPGR